MILEKFVHEFAQDIQLKTDYGVVIEKLKHFNQYRIVIIVRKYDRKRYVSTYICHENRRIVNETKDEIIKEMLNRVKQKEFELDVYYSKKVEEFEELIRQNMEEDREEMEGLYR